eukprot:ctg_2679.g469
MGAIVSPAEANVDSCPSSRVVAARRGRRCDRREEAGGGQNATGGSGMTGGGDRAVMDTVQQRLAFLSTQPFTWRSRPGPRRRRRPPLSASRATVTACVLSPDAVAERRVRVTVCGGGSFGSAMAFLLGSNGYPVTLLVRREAVAECINAERRNPRYFPADGDIRFPEAVRATTDVAEALRDCDSCCRTGDRAHRFSPPPRASSWHRSVPVRGVGVVAAVPSVAAADGISVGSVVRRRDVATAADGGGGGGARRDAATCPGGDAVVIGVQGVSIQRRCGGGGERRGEERDRRGRRHQRGTRIGHECHGGVGHTRLLGDAAAGAAAGRPFGHAGGTERRGRYLHDLLRRSESQPYLRLSSRARRAADPHSGDVSADGRGCAYGARAGAAHRRAVPRISAAAPRDDLPGVAERGRCVRGRRGAATAADRLDADAIRVGELAGKRGAGSMPSRAGNRCENGLCVPMKRECADVDEPIIALCGGHARMRVSTSIRRPAARQLRVPAYCQRVQQPRDVSRTSPLSPATFFRAGRLPRLGALRWPPCREPDLGGLMRDVGRGDGADDVEEEKVGGDASHGTWAVYMWGRGKDHRLGLLLTAPVAVDVMEPTVLPSSGIDRWYGALSARARVAQ